MLYLCYRPKNNQSQMKQENVTPGVIALRKKKESNSSWMYLNIKQVIYTSNREFEDKVFIDFKRPRIVS